MKLKLGVLTACGSALLCLGLTAYGQQTTVTITGANDGKYGSDYAGFYTFTVDGKTGVSVVCDDYADDNYVGDTDTVDIVNASQIANNLSLTKADNVIIYAEVAYLVEIDYKSTTTQAERDDISAAIWDIESGKKVVTLDADAQYYYDLATGLGYTTTTADNALDTTDSNLYLYTTSTGQEVWSEQDPLLTPEGGAVSLYLLLAGAVCFGAMAFSSRNQYARRDMVA